MGSDDLLANITCLVYSYDGTGMLAQCYELINYIFFKKFSR